MAPIGDPFVTNQRCRVSSSLSCSRRSSGSSGKSACEQPGSAPTHCLGAAAFVDLAGTIGSAGLQMIALVSGVGSRCGRDHERGQHRRLLCSVRPPWARAPAWCAAVASSFAAPMIITTSAWQSLIGLIHWHTYDIAEDGTLRPGPRRRSTDSRAALQELTRSAIMLRGLESADTKRIGPGVGRCEATSSRESAIEHIADGSASNPRSPQCRGVVADERRGRGRRRVGRLPPPISTRRARIAAGYSSRCRFSGSIRAGFRGNQRVLPRSPGCPRTAHG